MKFGIVIFPGSNCDHDCQHVVSNVLKQPVELLWHKDTDLKNCDALIVPGGFSYGDYLRCGAIAARSPIMQSVKDFADKGGLVFGICNGFQILVEAGLLPGVLMRNASLNFICKDIYLRAEHQQSPYTANLKAGEVLRVPIAHMEGNYFVDPRTLRKMETSNMIAFRYCDADGEVSEHKNPNGALANVAGVLNEQGNVCGMMPHPERCSEALLGNKDGLKIFESMLQWWTKKYEK